MSGVSCVSAPVLHNGHIRCLGRGGHHAHVDSPLDRLREAIGIGYYADGARIQVGMPAPFVQNLLDRYFTGLVPGDLAVGPMNPVVYRSAM